MAQLLLNFFNPFHASARPWFNSLWLRSFHPKIRFQISLAIVVCLGILRKVKPILWWIETFLINFTDSIRLSNRSKQFREIIWCLHTLFPFFLRLFAEGICEWSQLKQMVLQFTLEARPWTGFSHRIVNRQDTHSTKRKSTSFLPSLDFVCFPLVIQAGQPFHRRHTKATKNRLTNTEWSPRTQILFSVMKTNRNECFCAKKTKEKRATAHYQGCHWITKSCHFCFLFTFLGEAR